MRYLIALIIGIVALFIVNAFTGIFSLPRPWNSLSMGGVVGVTMVITLLIWESVRPSQHDGVPAKPKMSEDERAQARAERRARLAAEAGVSPETGDAAAVGPKDSERTEADTRGEGSQGKSAASPGPNATAAPGSAAAGSAAAAGAVPAAEGTRTDGSATQSADDATMPAEDEPQPGDDETQPGDAETQPADTATQRAADAKEAERAEASAVDEVEPDHAREAAERESEVRDESRDDSAQGSSLESPPVGEPGVSVDALDDEKDDPDSASGDEGRSH